MARKPKENLLGPAAVTPVMRAVVLELRKQHVSTKTAATDVVRAMPKDAKSGFVVTRHIEEATDLVNACFKRRHAKEYRNLGWKAASFYGLVPSRQNREARALMEGRATLAKRLTARIQTRQKNLREEMAIPAAKRVMKHGASAGSAFFVHIAPDADYTVETQRVWHGVNRGRDQWARLADTHHITLTPRWLGAVRRIGTATVDKRFILDATPFFESHGRSVWTARLARTGRGYQAKVEDGFLSVYGKDVTVHATLRAALNAQPPALAVEIERPIPDEDVEAINLAFA